MESLNLQKLIDFNRDVSRALVGERSKEEMRELFLPLGFTDCEIQQLSRAPVCLPGYRLLTVLAHLKLYGLIIEVFCLSSAERFKGEETPTNQDDQSHPYLH